MKRVAFIGHRDLYFGAESVMLRVIRFAKERDLAEPIVILPKSKFNGFRLQIEIDNIKEIKLFHYKLIGHSALRCYLCILYNLYSVFHAYFSLKRKKTDIIYTNTSVNIFGAMVAYLLRIPHFWHFHEQPSGGKFKWIPTALFPLYRFFINRKGTQIIFISNTQKLLWENEFNQSIPNSEVIYTPPVNLKASEKSMEASDTLIFGFLGSFTESKNILRLLTAAAQLKDEFPQQFNKLIIMGDGDFAEQIKAKITSLGLESTVDIWPHDEQIKPFYDAIDVFVLPSLFESWGLVALEAINEKKPVILTKNTGLTEILNHHEDCIFVDPLETSEIVFAMRTFLLDKPIRKMMAENAYRKIAALQFKERFESSFIKLFS